MCMYRALFRVKRGQDQFRVPRPMDTVVDLILRMIRVLKRHHIYRNHPDRVIIIKLVIPSFLNKKMIPDLVSLRVLAQNKAKFLTPLICNQMLLSKENFLPEVQEHKHSSLLKLKEMHKCKVLLMITEMRGSRMGSRVLVYSRVLLPLNAIPRNHSLQVCDPLHHRHLSLSYRVHLVKIGPALNRASSHLQVAKVTAQVRLLLPMVFRAQVRNSCN